MKPGESLLVSDMGSIGEAYEAIQKLPSTVEVFEMIPGAGGATLLLSGLAEALRECQRDLLDQKSAKILQPSEEIIQAYLGLKALPLKRYFGCFESTQTAEVFEAATRLEKAGWQIFDLRILRGSFLKTSLLATAEDSAAAQLGDLQGVWTQIKEPSEKLRTFFEI